MASRITPEELAARKLDYLKIQANNINDTQGSKFLLTYFSSCQQEESK